MKRSASELGLNALKGACCYAPACGAPAWAKTLDVTGDARHQCSDSGCRLCLACGRAYLAVYFAHASSTERIMCPGQLAADTDLQRVPRTRLPSKKSIYAFFRGHEAAYHQVVRDLAKAQRRSALRRLLFRTSERHVEVRCAACPRLSMANTATLDADPVTTCTLCAARTCAGCGYRVHTSAQARAHAAGCVAAAAANFATLGIGAVARAHRLGDVARAADLVAKLVQRVARLQCGICGVGVHDASMSVRDGRMHCRCGAVSCTACQAVYPATEAEHILSTKRRGLPAVAQGADKVAFGSEAEAWGRHRCPAAAVRHHTVFADPEVAVLLMGWRGKSYIPEHLWAEFHKTCALLRVLVQRVSRAFLVQCSGLVALELLFPSEPRVEGSLPATRLPEPTYRGTPVDFLLDRAALLHGLGGADVATMRASDERLAPFRK